MVVRLFNQQGTVDPKSASTGAMRGTSVYPLEIEEYLPAPYDTDKKGMLSRAHSPGAETPWLRYAA